MDSYIEAMRRDERICICCGEPITQAETGRGENPNVCLKCRFLGDGNEMTESSAEAKGLCRTEGPNEGDRTLIAKDRR